MDDFAAADNLDLSEMRRQFVASLHAPANLTCTDDELRAAFEEGCKIIEKYKARREAKGMGLCYFPALETAFREAMDALSHDLDWFTVQFRNSVDADYNSLRTNRPLLVALKHVCEKLGIDPGEDVTQALDEFEGRRAAEKKMWEELSNKKPRPTNG